MKTGYGTKQMYRKFMYRNLIIALIMLFAIAFILYSVPSLLGFGIIALTLGLRHGLDADHIVVVDNITRKLTIENKPSQLTGLFFALGHSTIVFILTILTIIGTTNSNFLSSTLSRIGDNVGGLISTSFLCLTLILNIVAFKNITKSNFSIVSTNGIIFRLANKYIFRAINSSKQMYVVGFFFGLGFDTATEIGLLTLAALSVMHGNSLWFTLLLPILFASGMIFTDTMNSIFMSKLYNWCKTKTDRCHLYNYFVLGFAIFSTALVITVQSAGYIAQHIPLNKVFMGIIGILDEHSGLIGVGIIGVFALLMLSIYLKTHKRYKF